MLKNDRDRVPRQEDFVSVEGYYQWNSEVRMSFQRVLTELLTARYLSDDKRRQRSEKPGTSVDLRFKVVSASNLLAKEERIRDAYAQIEFGNIPEDWEDIKREQSKRDRQVFKTEVVSSNNPFWNQHIKIEAKNLTDSILICVYCQRKDEFLGYARLKISELITASVKEGFVRKDIALLPRENKKDKYAGGEVTIEVSLADGKKVFISLFCVLSPFYLLDRRDEPWRRQDRVHSIAAHFLQG